MLLKPTFSGLFSEPVVCQTCPGSVAEEHQVLFKSWDSRALPTSAEPEPVNVELWSTSSASFSGGSYSVLNAAGEWGGGE